MGTSLMTSAASLTDARRILEERMLKKFINSLKQSPRNTPVFNPWWQTDLQNDINGNGAEIRRKQLRQYLGERIGSATLLLVGEALGYQGGHFSGIPMMSERILLNGHIKKGILPQHVFSTLPPRRTSRPELKPNGFSEPTATIVWEHIIRSDFDPRSFILWNAFPWHPFKPNSGYLSNRTPTESELLTGAPILIDLIRMSGIDNIIAVGEKAYAVLKKQDIAANKVRHPANGGAGKFRQQFSRIFNGLKKKPGAP